MNQYQPRNLPWDVQGRWGRKRAKIHSEMQAEWRVSICNVSSQDLSFDHRNGTSPSWDPLSLRALWGGRYLLVVCVPGATCRAAPPPNAAPPGAMAYLLPGTSPLSAGLIFTYFIFLFLARKTPAVLLCPPHSLLSCYRDFPHSFVHCPWHVFRHASVHAQQGSCITNLYVFPHQSCYICLCLLISIFAAYGFCPFLQLYIFAVLSWILCRLRCACYAYDALKLLFLSFLPKLRIKKSCSNQVIKIQYKLYLTVLWHLCQTCASSPVAQLGKPKAEGLTLPKWWAFLAAFTTVCLTDLIILSSSVCKWTVILVQVIKRKDCADNWLIRVHFEPKPLE